MKTVVFAASICVVMGLAAAPPAPGQDSPKGKDGSDVLKPGQRPRLTDWTLVERRFRASSPVRSRALEKRIAELKNSYLDAAEATDDAMANPSSTAARALAEAYRRYNNRLDELQAELFPSQPLPLPRLNPMDASDLEKYVRDWTEAKRMQYHAETLAAEIQGKKSDLTNFTEGMRETERYKQAAKSLEKDEANLDKLNAALAGEFQKLEQRLVDTSHVLPPADQFGAKAGSLAYVGNDLPQILKTDDKGNPLAGDKQPAGYPKAFRGEPLKTDENLFVEPVVRLIPLEKDAEVRAGVYGKVVDVDPKSGGITVQVSESGAQVQYAGIDPAGISEGDFITPAMPIGRVRPAPKSGGSAQLLIRTLDAQKQTVRPGPMLDYARTPPKVAGQLQRGVPEVNSPVLAPASASKSPPGKEGKYNFNQQVVFDDSVKKGTKGEPSLTSKLSSLDAREVVAQRELAREREAKTRQEMEAGNLKAMLRTIEGELQSAQGKLDELEAGKAKLEKQEAAFEVTAKRLLGDKETLKKAKADLDARKSVTQAEADAHNKRAKAWHEQVGKYNSELSAFQKEKSARESAMTKATGELRKLDQEKQRLEGSVVSAQTESTRLQSQLQSLEDSLAAIAAERAKLQSGAKPVESK